MSGAEHGFIDPGRRSAMQNRGLHQQIAPRTKDAGGMAAYLLHLQRTIGNQAVGQLLQRYRRQVAGPHGTSAAVPPGDLAAVEPQPRAAAPEAGSASLDPALRAESAAGETEAPEGIALPDHPEAVIQRMTVNVGPHPLTDLDVGTAKTLNMALQENPGQAIVEFEAADFSAVGVDETIFFLGHGSPGKIGVKTAEEVSKKLLAQGTGLPQGYHGRIESLSCSTGTKVQEGRKKHSAAGTLSRRLRKARRTGITITGAKGPSLRHPKHGTRVITPQMWKAEAREWQTTNKEYKDIKQTWAEWREKNKSADLLTQATKAAQLMDTFMEGYMQNEKWFFSKAKGSAKRVS